MAKLHATPPPTGLPHPEPALLAGWSLVADDPTPFLSLGLCPAEWLKAALPALLSAELDTPLEGDELVHLDVRSDNLCFANGRVLLVDWNLACRANGLLDVAFWLPSLEAEGGPRPETVAPETSVFAAAISGFFAARAGLPLIEHAPFVRRVQDQQLRTALPWAIRALDLPPLGYHRHA